MPLESHDYDATPSRRSSVIEQAGDAINTANLIRYNIIVSTRSLFHSNNHVHIQYIIHNL